MNRRKIAVVTGSRADYGLLSNIMDSIRKSSKLTLQILVTGMHLDDKFGATWRQIEADGFVVDRKVPSGIAGSRPADIGRAMGKTLSGFADAFETSPPDIALVLGDRFEIFCAVAAALPFNIPVAHIHGGEQTQGSIDDCFRNAISKMAHLHFVATPLYGKRVIQMGESPDRVHVVGAPGLDALARIKFLGRAELERAIGLPLRPPVLLATYHPVTVEPERIGARVAAFLDGLARSDVGTIVFTGVNADTGHDEVIRRIQAFVAARRDRAVYRVSLGQQLYLSLAKLSDAIVGNSSSGIIEMPSLGVPVVNVGDRQSGRVKARSIIDCEETADAVASAIRQALTPEFRSLAQRTENPYGAPGAPARIVTVLERVDLAGLARKKFHDLP
ncbi:MAG: UDP-N-acetylglucosamine 2-epimerase (hydrolyzing) [Alphaproteobacteria bacterium]|nr:UDP-N-acetylglucosamine 2-epimerase (hydrolyzing) [Alphaproteobacteria bacterium]